MIRALFYTTTTNECENHVKAWNSFAQSDHVTFNHTGLNNGWQLPAAIREHKPDVVFYIGANEGRGVPKINIFKEARELVPIINICSDAEDTPWHGTLRYYKNHQCFDLQVAIDGAITAPVDLATLTPVNPFLFIRKKVPKTIRCGFSGTVGRWNPRSEIINSLEWFGGLTVRKREEEDGYYNHVDFLKRCKMLLNVSFTGSGNKHHIKGRVLEAGWASCCLLEHEDSPIGNWFPEDCYIKYRHPKDIAEIIANLDDDVIENTAYRLHDEVRNRYTPEIIYGEILRGIDFVDIP